MRLIVEVDQNPLGGNTMIRKKHNPESESLEALVSFDKDLLLELMKAALEEVLEVEMSEQLGAAPVERSPGRLGYRSGYYHRYLVTRIGKLELRVPRDRDGRFSTELFDRYQELW